MRLPRDAVLMIIDCQEAIEDPCWGPLNNPDADEKIAALLAAWRGRRLPIVHIRHDSVDPQSPYRPGARGHAFKVCAAPLPGEPVVGKSTTSAFLTADLAPLLDRLGVTTLVICGWLTSNSVEATVRHAGDLGYRVFVVADACRASDVVGVGGRTWPAAAVHAMSLANMAREYGRVVACETALNAAAMAGPDRARSVEGSG